MYQADLSAPYDTMALTLTSFVTEGDAEVALKHGAAAWLAIISERFDEARLAAARALAVKDPAVPEAVPTLRALTMMVDAFSGRSSIDQAMLDALVDRADVTAAGRVPVGFEAALEIANWFTFADRYDDAAFVADRRIHLSRRQGDIVGETWSLTCRVELDLRRGRWNQCRQALDAATQLSARHDLPTGYIDVLAARLAASQGRAEDLAHHLQSARSYAYDLGDASTRWRADAAEGHSALAGGDPETAAELLAPLVMREWPAGGYLASVRMWDADLIEALVRSGDLEAAERARTRLRTPFPSAWSTATAMRCNALLRADLGAGVVEASRSADLFAGFGATFEAARSHLVAGELARRAKAVASARRLLRTAWTTFSALDAGPWTDRAARELRACGAGQGPGDTRSAGLVSLTGHELEIVRAVCTGASNREVSQRLFISVKTVEAHLTGVYRKLGVSSRGQLIASFGRESETHRESPDATSTTLPSR